MSDDIPELPEVPDKNPLGLVITSTAIAAFTASNLYVFGLSLGLKETLATHFEVLDYIQITPAWALPAFILYVVFDFCAVIFAVMYVWISDFGRAIFKKKASPIQPGEKRSIVSLLRAVQPIVLWPFKAFIYAYATILIPFAWPFRKLAAWKKGADVCFALALLSISGVASNDHSGLPQIFAVVAIARVVSLAVSWGLPRLTEEVNPLPFDFTVLKPREVRICATAAGVLAFAFCYGLFVAPDFIMEAPSSKVFLSKDGPEIHGHVSVPGTPTEVTFGGGEDEVEGQIVVRLSHSLLLIAGVRGLVVVPQEKIERTETEQPQASELHKLIEPLSSKERQNSHANPESH
jgi:hypothetical protein